MVFRHDGTLEFGRRFDRRRERVVEVSDTVPDLAPEVDGDSDILVLGLEDRDALIDDTESSDLAFRDYKLAVRIPFQNTPEHISHRMAAYTSETVDKNSFPAFVDTCKESVDSD